VLEKELDFKNTTIVEICTAFASGMISIILAVYGFGAWSLVFGSLSGSLVSVIILWKISRWKPSLNFSIQHFKELFRFGANVTGSKIFGYFILRMDFLVVGKLFGTTALGYYTIARNLTSFPVQKISWTIMRVTFPAFAKIQKNNEMLRKGYLNVIKYVSLVTFPMLAGMFVIASEFVLVVYGEKWSPMIILLQIFSIGGAIVSIGAIESTVLFSKGRSDLQFKLQIYSTIMMLIGVSVGAYFGLVGMAIAVTIMTAFSILIFQIMVNKLIGLDMYTFIKEIIPAAVCSIILIIGIEIYKRTIFINDVQLIYIFLSSVFVGTLVYLILIRIFYNHILGEIFNEIKLLVHKMKMKG
jgi:PST family polysaccharide transporter